MKEEGEWVKEGKVKKQVWKSPFAELPIINKQKASLLEAFFYKNERGIFNLLGEVEFHLLL